MYGVRLSMVLGPLCGFVLGGFDIFLAGAVIGAGGSGDATIDPIEGMF